MYENQKDPLTNQSFLPKRSNQKFSSRGNRIIYNNRKAKNIRNERAKFDKPLHNNYKILKNIMADKKEIIIHREFLLGKGFVFDVFTSGEKEGEFINPAYYNFIIIPLEEDSDHVKIKKL
ncbi:MAG: hypothetical protein ACRDE2_07835 [Chitinophagaceae bacterium]